MSPFSSLLRSIRTSHAICQSELANLVGYEQTYISALEIGKKGPPTQEFIERLIKALNLSDDESKGLYEAADASNRKLVIKTDVSQEVYWLFSDLRKHLQNLSPVQIRLLRDIVSLKESLNVQPNNSITQIRRRKTWKEKSK
jgi:transcriptional regulator with XRE-family HTH domain